MISSQRVDMVSTNYIVNNPTGGERLSTVL